MGPPYLEILCLLLHQPLHMYHRLPPRPVSQGCYCDSLHPVSRPQALPPPVPSLLDHAFLRADGLSSFHNVPSHMGHWNFLAVLNLECSHLLFSVSNIGQLWMYNEFSQMASHGLLITGRCFLF